MSPMTSRLRLRKFWLLCAMFGSAAAAAAGPATAQTPLPTAKVANDFALMMVDYGDKLGTFKKQGLDVEVTQITQAKMIQAVVAGSIDIALASGATLAFAPKGAPLKAVAALSGPPSILVLVVRPDGAIASAEQLRHRTVAVTNVGSLTDWAVSQIAVHRNWPQSDIKRVSVGDTPARLATLKTGDADAAVVDLAAALDLEQRGEVKILLNFGDLIQRFQNQIIYASDRLIETKPDAVRGFIRGWFDTLDHARRNRSETVDFAAQALSIKPAVAGRVYDQLMPGGFFSTDGRFDRETLRAVADSLVEMKLIDRGTELSQYVTERFLPKTP